ncbi:hypothetical protein ES708_24772 [subsurface metagenome]
MPDSRSSSPLSMWSLGAPLSCSVTELVWDFHRGLSSPPQVALQAGELRGSLEVLEPLSASGLVGG